METNATYDELTEILSEYTAQNSISPASVKIEKEIIMFFIVSRIVQEAHRNDTLQNNVFSFFISFICVILYRKSDNI